MVNKKPSFETVFCAATDLFIVNSEDKVTDYQFGKPQTNKHGDVVILNGIVVS